MSKAPGSLTRLMQPTHNTLFYGDCLEVMSDWDEGIADLIYLDPPFNSNANYNILFKDRKGRRGRGATGRWAQAIAFEDTWYWDDAAMERFMRIERSQGNPTRSLLVGLRHAVGDTGMLAYLTYMADRLVALRRVLKPTGTVYLHCDPTAGHYLKLLMDQIFGGENFISEIIWNYGTPSGGRASGRRPVKAHETLLVYAREYSKHTFNFLYTDYSPEYIEAWFSNVDEDGRHYQTRTRSGEIVRQYLDESPGVPLSNVWSDIRQLYAQRGWFPNTKANKEDLGYPTQKPVNLLERVISMSSNEGDLVLDPFCGCGTTVVAADNLNRRWLGIDVSPFAIELIRTRRFQGNEINVSGVPFDMEAARLMASSRPFDFEKWAVTRLPGMVPNSRQVRDQGIDGRGRTLEKSNDGNLDLIVAQVKGGRFGIAQLREFMHVVDRDGAAIGLLITVDRVKNRAARAAAASAGTMSFGSSSYPKVQMWSIEQWFEGQRPELPALADPYTGKPMMESLGARA